MFALAPEQAVPGINEASKPAAKAFGALQAMFGILMLYLGAVNHALYCTMMTFHLLVAGLIGAEAYGSLALADGAPHPRFQAIAAGHAVSFAIMLGVLITGGIHDKKKSKRS